MSAGHDRHTELYSPDGASRRIPTAAQALARLGMPEFAGVPDDVAVGALAGRTDQRYGLLGLRRGALRPWPRLVGQSRTPHAHRDRDRDPNHSQGHRHPQHRAGSGPHLSDTLSAEETAATAS